MEVKKDTIVTKTTCEDKTKQVISSYNNCFSPCMKRKDYKAKNYEMLVK